MTEKPYTVTDRRGKEEPTEVCRVCGSPEVHSRGYNFPTMKCIEFLRSKIDTRLDDENKKLKNELNELKQKLADQNNNAITFGNGV